MEFVPEQVALRISYLLTVNAKEKTAQLVTSLRMVHVSELSVVFLIKFTRMVNVFQPNVLKEPF